MTSIRKMEPLPAPEARQGVRGMRVFLILVSALVLTAIGWAGVEMWGATSIRTKTPTAPSASVALTAMPTQSNDTAATQPALLPTDIDKSDNNQVGIKSTPTQPNRDGTQK